MPLLKQHNKKDAKTPSLKNIFDQVSFASSFFRLFEHLVPQEMKEMGTDKFHKPDTVLHNAIDCSCG